MTIIKKILCDTLRVDDPIGFIVANADNREILSQLDRKYRNKCYMSALILRITRIIRRSIHYVNQDGINDISANPVCGFINVEFEVDAVVYYPREIISGCVVRNNDEYDNIYCDSELANIYISPHNNNRSIKVGQIVSVVVDNTMYEVMQSKISIGASLFVPTVYCIAYQVGQRSGVDFTAVAALSQDLENITNSKEQIELSKTTAWKSFAKLIYAHISQDDGKDALNIFDIINYAINDANDAQTALQSAVDDKIPRYIVSDSRLDPTKPIVRGFANSADLPPNCEILSGLTLDSIFSAILANYRNYLGLVNGMVTAYPTDVVADHVNLWKIYGLNRV